MTPGPSTPPPSATRTRSGRLDPDELAALEDQRDFLLRSLEDLEREREAGDLDEHDYETLKDDYTGRAAETIRAIDERRAAFASARRTSGRGRTLAVFAGVVAFAVLAGLLVANSLGARQAGDTASGGISVAKSPSQRAQECIAKMAPQAPAEALDCFRQVLVDDPRNAVAKAWSGWQIELASSAVADPAQRTELQGSAERLVDEAVAENPDYSYARAFRAVLAYRHEDYPLAKQYLDEFRANDPSPDAESVIDQFDLESQIDQALASNEVGGPGAGLDPGPSAPTATSTPD